MLCNRWLIALMIACVLFICVVLQGVTSLRPQINWKASDWPQRKKKRLMLHQSLQTFVSTCVTTEQKSHHIISAHWAQVIVTVDLHSTCLCRRPSLNSPAIKSASWLSSVSVWVSGLRRFLNINMGSLFCLVIWMDDCCCLSLLLIFVIIFRSWSYFLLRQCRIDWYQSS